MPRLRVYWTTAVSTTCPTFPNLPDKSCHYTPPSLQSRIVCVLPYPNLAGSVEKFWCPLETRNCWVSVLKGRPLVWGRQHDRQIYKKRFPSVSAVTPDTGLSSSYMRDLVLNFSKIWKHDIYTLRVSINDIILKVHVIIGLQFSGRWYTSKDRNSLGTTILGDPAHTPHSGQPNITTTTFTFPTTRIST